MTKKVSRRTFIQGSATAGVAVGASSVVINTNESWALSTEVLSSDTAQSLLAMARHLYPHDFLGDQYYAQIVSDLDEQAKSDSSLAEKLENGVKELSKVIEGDRTYDISFKDPGEVSCWMVGNWSLLRPLKIGPTFVIFAKFIKILLILGTKI